MENKIRGIALFPVSPPHTAKKEQCAEVCTEETANKYICKAYVKLCDISMHWIHVTSVTKQHQHLLDDISLAKRLRYKNCFIAKVMLTHFLGGSNFFITHTPDQFPDQCRGWWWCRGEEGCWPRWRAGKEISLGCLRTMCRQSTSSSCQISDDL